MLEIWKQQNDFMNNNFNTSFEKFKRTHLKELFETLESVFLGLDIDYYLVGAFAKEVWATVFDLHTPRITKDIDLAVLIPNKATFEALREQLIATGKFESISNNEIKFMFDNAIELDLIPFGGLDLFAEDSPVEIAAYAALPDNGFQEIYDEGATTVKITDDFSFKVSSLPSIVLLKLLAFDNAPDIRVKDMQDICNILKNYFDVASSEIYEAHDDLFEDENFTEESAASRVLGRHITPILKQNSQLQKRVIGILETALAAGENNNLALKMVEGTDEELETAISLLDTLLKGILDERQPHQHE